MSIYKFGESGFKLIKHVYRLETSPGPICDANLKILENNLLIVEVALEQEQINVVLDEFFLPKQVYCFKSKYFENSKNNDVDFDVRITDYEVIILYKRTCFEKQMIRNTICRRIPLQCKQQIFSDEQFIFLSLKEKGLLQFNKLTKSFRIIY